MSHSLSTSFRADGDGFYTYEFDAASCGLAYTFHDNNDFKFAWAVTVEYSSSSLDS